MNILAKIFGSNERELARLQAVVEQVNKLEPEFEKLSGDGLKDKTKEFRQQLQEKLSRYRSEQATEGLTDQEVEHFEQAERQRRLKFEQDALDALLPAAFAAVREAAKRTIEQRHYDVQVMGGIILHQGKIAEMKTGEGKTLVATLPLYLNALLGQGAHLVTVNDFLAKYHAQWMGEIYHALGMSSAAIEHDKSWRFSYEAKPTTHTEEEAIDAGLIDPDWPHLKSVSRQEAYAADIIYGTNNEFGFDYLRDNMIYLPEDRAQRSHRFAIVDEVDSILIDEARTPLIISAPAEESASLYSQFAGIAKQLKPDIHYKIDEKERAVSITDLGIAAVEQATGLKNFYDAANIIMVHHLEAALKAQALFKGDKDYVVRNGEIVIVDEFTGRLMEGRRYSEGLHQAIEAKEGVEVKRESDTLATISFQNLFRMYDKLAGMTGTAETEAEEFWKIYKLDVVVVPTHRPMVRVDHQDKIYKNETGKYKAVIADVKECYEKGQPVLIGTISVQKNEMLSDLLQQAGVKHRILNAKQHEKEAQIIAQAGRLRAVTLATNMAGRGVDIILGGLPTDPAEAQMVKELGGLHVIGTERHESRRIDNQLRGRSGRQGDPGSSVFYVSMEDDLMRIFGGDRMKAVMERLGLPDEEALQHSMLSNNIEQAQKRVEGHNFDIRKHLVEYDDVMNKHRTVIYRQRNQILLTNPQKDNWLHGDILDMLDEDERKIFDEKFKRFGEEAMKQLERIVYLRVIDQFWIDHLNAMQELREGIGLRGYGQHDPLVEYKHEAYNLFQRLMVAIDDEVVEIILKSELVQTQPAPQLTRPLVFSGADDALAGGAISNITAADQIESGNMPRLQPPAEAPTRDLQESNTGVRVAVRQARTVQNERRKIGRNHPCWCGSGKKFKRCHGK